MENRAPGDQSQNLNATRGVEAWGGYKLIAKPVSANIHQIVLANFSNSLQILKIQQIPENQRKYIKARQKESAKKSAI